MMPESKLFTAYLFRRIVKHSSSHSGTKTAGAFFLSLVKNNFTDVGALYNKPDPKLIAQRKKRLIVRAYTVKLRIKRNGANRITFWVKTAHSAQCRKQHDRIFSARNSNSNFIAVLNHIVIIAGASYIRKHFFHKLHLKILFPSYYTLCVILSQRRKMPFTHF